MKKYSGYFIAFEGGEGTGKSSATKMIEDLLKKDGFDVVITREPGGIPSAESIRKNIVDYNIDSKTELLLFLAARREHLIKKVIPALQEGKIVISDRFSLSSIVYQGFARGLGIDEVRNLNSYTCDNFTPDLNVVIGIPAEVSIERKQNSGLEMNRLDLESIHFHKKVEEGYKIVANQKRENISIIDGLQPLELMVDNIYSVILNEMRKP